MATPLNMGQILGQTKPQYLQVKSESEAGLRNREGYQLVPGQQPLDGTFLMQKQGQDPAAITQALLGQYQDAYTNGPDEIMALGATQSRDINDRATQLAAQTSQSAISRGLSNNSAIQGLQRGVEMDRARQQIILNDSLRRQALDYRFNALDKIGDLSLGLQQLQSQTTPYEAPAKKPESRLMFPNFFPRLRRKIRNEGD